MSSNGTNKRRFQRHPASLKAALCFHSWDVPTRVETVDLGVEGIQCLSCEPIPDGTRVLVRLQLVPGETWLECKGKICWARLEEDSRTRFGIRFLDLIEDEREMLDLFLVPI